MKIVDENTIGGRIRKCRQARNLTLTQLAEGIDVSPNYMSAVERGVKNPSEKVLCKIAALAGVPCEWLKTGQKKSPEDSPVSPQKPSFLVNSQGSISRLNTAHVIIDVPLFMSLVIQSTPDMHTERLASILGVSQEDMKKILLGDDEATSPDWDDYFLILLQRMDLPAICPKVHALDLLLQNENRERGQKRLLDLANRYVGSDYEYFRFLPIPEELEEIHSTTNILYSEHIMFLRSEAPQTDDDNYGSWHFFFYRFNDIDEPLFESLMSIQISYCREHHCNSTLVFDDNSILDLFKEEYERQQKSSESSDRRLDDGVNRLPTLSLLLVDRITWHPQGKLIYLDNDGQLDQANT